jgi:hypothetical protein
MLRFIMQAPATIDGHAAWAEVVGGIRRTLEDPLRGLPVLGMFLLVIAIVWANLRVARWLAGPDGSGGAQRRRG